jgi:zinc transporter ZupT
MKVLPYAKSESARRQLLPTLAIVGLIGMIFGWIGALVALAIAVPLVRKLEQHHFFGHDGTDDTEI